MLKPFYGGLGSILMFHRVCHPSGRKSVPGASSIECNPERFQEILDHLVKNQYHFISLDELHRGLNQNSLEKRFATITFDDGYVDNYSIVYPILKERQIPFTIYVTTSFPDGKAILWWYLLEELLDANGIIKIRENEHQSVFNLSDNEQRKQASWTIRRIMKSSTPSNFKYNIDNIFTANGLNPYSHVKALSLTWDQIIELSRDPLVTIGAHTVNHYQLSHLEEKDATAEVALARNRLSETIRKPVDHFAYPFGGRAAAVEREFQIIKKLDFKTATTTRTANVFAEHRDHLEALPRLDMGMFSNNDQLDLGLNGWLPARLYRFQRVVTL